LRNRASTDTNSANQPSFMINRETRNHQLLSQSKP
jgi:hypothetical protein